MLITYDWELLDNFWGHFWSLCIFNVSKPIFVFFCMENQFNFRMAELPFLQIYIFLVFLIGTCLKKSQLWSLKCSKVLIKKPPRTFDLIFGINTSYLLKYLKLRKIEGHMWSPFMHPSVHPHNKGFWPNFLADYMVKIIIPFFDH